MSGAIATDICDVRLQRTSNVTARKSYKCSSCGERIEPGERYRYTVVFWKNGDRDTWRYCQRCAEVEDFLIYAPGDGYDDCGLEEGETPLSRFWNLYQPADVPEMAMGPHSLSQGTVEWLLEHSPEEEED